MKQTDISKITTIEAKIVRLKGEIIETLCSVYPRTHITEEDVDGGADGEQGNLIGQLIPGDREAGLIKAIGSHADDFESLDMPELLELVDYILHNIWLLESET